MTDLWVERHRPKTMDDYVLADERLRVQIDSWVRDRSLPHLGLFGRAGSGKTTLAFILLNLLKVDPADILQLNGSRENNVETVREKIQNFVTGMSFGDGMRYVFIDEADYLSQAAQAILRNLIETYSGTSRFIMTGNYPDRIIPAIKSRLQVYHFNSLDLEAFRYRAAQVLILEGIDFDPDLSTLDSIVRASFPDLRKCINLLQQYSIEGKLTSINQDNAGESNDYLVSMVELFKSGKITEARKLIGSQITTEQYEDVYRFLYKNLDLWGNTESQQEQAIITIRDGLLKHGQIADPEINLSATLITLKNIKEQQ